MKDSLMVKRDWYLSRVVHVIRFRGDAVPLEVLQIKCPHVVKRLLNAATIPNAPKNNDGVMGNSSCMYVKLT